MWNRPSKTLPPPKPKTRKKFRCFGCDHKEYIRNNYPPRILKPNYTSNVTCSEQTHPINTTNTSDYTLGTSKVEPSDNSFTNSCDCSCGSD